MRQGTTGSCGMVPGKFPPSAELNPQGYQHFRDEPLLFGGLLEIQNRQLGDFLAHA